MIKKFKTDPIKIRGFIFGCLLLLISYSIWSDKSDFFYQGASPVDRSIWILFFVVGLISILYSVLSKTKPPERDEFNSKICPTCLKRYSGNVEETKCAACKIDLEPTEGFLERHPYAFRKHKP